MAVEIMTVADAVLRIRAEGIPISHATLSGGIEQGVYPFGDCVKTDKGGRKLTVYKRLLDDWIAKRAVS